ncbi:MAG: BlaI/MecI/CopY family transcriptional regulator [Candidatus Thermoplasmatota archaeon]|nr:BlaI/MecI/CopY family transcriptional regulator [Candidatus Thermoplasmatota archaeon]
MADEDLEKQIRSLSDKMESLEESMRMVATPYSQLLEYIERFQKISSSYFRLIDIYQKYGEIAPDLLVPGVKDSISREIVKILFDRDGQNISQITQRLKERRGTSSRRTVRERLKELQEKGVVVSRGSEREKVYWLTEGYVKKWYELLGLGLGKDEQDG